MTIPLTSPLIHHAAAAERRGAGRHGRMVALGGVLGALMLAVPALAGAEDCLPQTVNGYATDLVRVLEGERYALRPADELAPPECIVAVDDARGLRQVRLADGERLWVPTRDLRISRAKAAVVVQQIGPRQVSPEKDWADEQQTGVKAIGDELEREQEQ